MSRIVLPPGIEALLFDFDGVLADTEPIHWRVWRKLLAGQGIDLPWDYYRDECIGVTDRAMLERLARLSQPPKPPHQLVPLKPLKKAQFLEAALSELELPEGTRKLMEVLSEQRKAIVTSSTTFEIRAILKHLDLVKYFETVVFGDEVRNHKPDPEPYLEASRRLGIERALVFEDSDAGLASARAAGHLAVRVLSADSLAATVVAAVHKLGGRISLS